MPVRLVVDPTMTGLNEILAKGVNMLLRIPELLIRFQCFRWTWNTEISELYNQLHLNSGLLTFSLFLFHHDLDLSTPPSVWVMSRTWYSVSCTGNQVGVAIEHLAFQFKDVHPLERGWSTTDSPFRETGGFENLRFLKNAILVVQHSSGASNAWLKNIESLKLKLRESFLGFS